MGGILPSRNIVVTNNILHGGCGLKLGSGATHSAECVVQGNTIIRGSKSITGFARVTERDNLVCNQGAPIPPNPTVFIRPGRYDPDRASLAILNVARGKSVDVDASTFRRNGEGYRIASARDYFGTPCARGIYNDAPAHPQSATSAMTIAN